MVRALILPTVCGALLAGHVFVSTNLPAYRAGLIEQSEEIIPLPAGVLKLISLDYRNLVADLIFSRTMSFYGGKLNRRETVDAETYRTIYNRLDVASDLDPYFVDPYFFGQSVLAWGAGMPMEANALLDRGRRFLTDDWVIPFFMGFNAFYFLHDNAQGAAYLMESSRRPGSPPLMGLLAVRLASQSGGAETAIAFLQELEAQTDDLGVKSDLRNRAEALRGISVIEQAVKRYREIFGKNPVTLRDLQESTILPLVPIDPYGGEFYIAPDGRVWTTSDLRPVAE